MVVEWVEVVGYVASALIVWSLTMTSLLRLRVVNLAGAIVFTAYGLLISAPPVWVVNAAIAVIDVVQLWRMTRGEERFEVLQVDPDDAYVRRFLSFHADDIATFQPSFDGVRDDHRAWFVLRDAVPAALVLARRDGEETVVDLDYAIPSSRDLEPGAFLHRDTQVLERLGGRRVVAHAATDEHQRYLRRVGFDRDRDGRFVRAAEDPVPR